MAYPNRIDDEDEPNLNKMLIPLVLVFFFAGLTFMRWAEDYPVVWRYSIWRNSPNSLALTSLVTTLLVIIPINKFIHARTSLYHGRELTFHIFFALGIPLFLVFTQLGLLFNGALDSSDSKTFQTHVIGKRTSKSYRSSQQWFFLDVRDWRDASGTVQISVRRYQYDDIAIGTPVRVVTKSGALGYEWIVSRSIEAK